MAPTRRSSTMAPTRRSSTMAPTRRSTRAAVTKNQREPVAQRRATKQAPAPKNIKEATTTIEEEQAAQELPVSRSRKRGRGVDEPLAFLEPRSLGTAVARKSHNLKTGRGTQLASIQVTLQKVKVLCLGKVTD